MNMNEEQSEAKSQTLDPETWVDALRRPGWPGFEVQELEEECPAHWESEKAELDQMICDIRDRWSEASEMSPDDFD
ncbi:MAG: hypothetical protein PVH99_01735 [Desulfobacteraceae bacterium]|jgi:hypothetical protein